MEAKQDNNRFHQAVRRISNSEQYEARCNTLAPYGYFAARPIIGECTRVSGGIYLGVIPHEAVVVDESYGLLKKLYLDMTVDLVKQIGKKLEDEEKVVSHVFRLVNVRLNLNPQGVRDLAFRKNILPDTKTALDFYLQAGIGAARHRVLLAAYLLEKLKEREILFGCHGIDAHFEALPAEDEKLTYTSQSGKLYLYNPLTAGVVAR